MIWHVRETRLIGIPQTFPALLFMRWPWICRPLLLSTKLHRQIIKGKRRNNLVRCSGEKLFYLPLSVQHSDTNDHPLSPGQEQGQMYEYYYRRAARHQVPGPRRCRQPVVVPAAIWQRKRTSVWVRQALSNVIASVWGCSVAWITLVYSYSF